jgi:hypothetical protein
MREIPDKTSENLTALHFSGSREPRFFGQLEKARSLLLEAQENSSVFRKKKSKKMSVIKRSVSFIFPLATIIFVSSLEKANATTVAINAVNSGWFRHYPLAARFYREDLRDKIAADFALLKRELKKFRKLQAV